MLQDLAAVAAGVVVLYAGAEGLVRGSVSLALRLRITPLAVGLTVVAFGTSMPEMVVSVGAALSGAAAIAAGNVVGSNIANVALILGISAILCTLAVHTRIVRIDLPLMVLTSLVLAAMMLDGNIGRLEGALLAAGLAVYTVLSLRAARRETAAAPLPVSLPTAMALSTSLALLAGGLVLLVIGARMLVSGAVGIAETSGVSEAVIGLTVVAVGTSLPELATSVLAAFKREGDLAVGNIVGSNIFNILGILGVAALARPLQNTGMSAVDLGVMIALAILLLPLARSGWRLSRWEGGVLFTIYVAYVVHLLLR